MGSSGGGIFGSSPSGSNGPSDNSNSNQNSSSPF
jgi:hypothetical protein